MREVAPGVHLITGFPPYAINCYLIAHPDGDVLVDAMTRLDARRILKAVRGRRLAAHVATHAHPDHVGATHAVASKLGIPVWAHALDRPAVEDTALIEERQPKAPINKLFSKVMLGPGHPVSRELAEGDDVAGFEVLHVPGHSIGHIALWRASDGVLILGDVLNNQHPLLGFPAASASRSRPSPRPGDQPRVARRLGTLDVRTGPLRPRPGRDRRRALPRVHRRALSEAPVCGLGRCWSRERLRGKPASSVDLCALSAHNSTFAASGPGRRFDPATRLLARGSVGQAPRALAGGRTASAPLPTNAFRSKWNAPRYGAAEDGRSEPGGKRAVERRYIERTHCKNRERLPRSAHGCSALPILPARSESPNAHRA
jgi:glyoxylase-like metal-dependent hydrolase (beta-lactamase superfamily II)